MYTEADLKAAHGRYNAAHNSYVSALKSFGQRHKITMDRRDTFDRCNQEFIRVYKVMESQHEMSGM